MRSIFSAATTVVGFNAGLHFAHLVPPSPAWSPSWISVGTSLAIAVVLCCYVSNSRP
jgi:hypothetical protein